MYTFLEGYVFEEESVDDEEFELEPEFDHGDTK
jgi:hypothetical protein